MAQVHYIEGSVVDGFCPKCEAVTEHTIVKCTKRSIREVKCEACSFAHKYQKAATAKATKAKAKKKKAAAKKTKTKRTRKKAAEIDELAQIKAEWEAACLEHGDEKPRDYNLRQEWLPGAVLLHPIFGKGVVMKVLSEKKVEVIFQNARKRLVQNVN